MFFIIRKHIFFLFFKLWMNNDHVTERKNQTCDRSKTPFHALYSINIYFDIYKVEQRRKNASVYWCSSWNTFFSLFLEKNIKHNLCYFELFNRFSFIFTQKQTIPQDFIIRLSILNKYLYKKLFLLFWQMRKNIRNRFYLKKSD